jgi:hypothetical protein
LITSNRKLTRREMAGALMAATAFAQTPAPPLPPAAELENARNQVKESVAALQQIEVPMTTAPAFQFKA